MRLTTGRLDNHPHLIRFRLSTFGLVLPQQLSGLYYCSLRPYESVTAPANIMIPSMNVQIQSGIRITMPMKQNSVKKSPTRPRISCAAAVPVSFAEPAPGAHVLAVDVDPILHGVSRYQGGWGSVDRLGVLRIAASAAEYCDDLPRHMIPPVTEPPHTGRWREPGTNPLKLATSPASSSVFLGLHRRPIWCR
jgi:hypothetical protein